MESINEEFDREIERIFSTTRHALPRINDVNYSKLITLIRENPSYLIRHFERLFNMTCHEFIRSLQTPTRTIDRIHELLSYVDLMGHFARICEERNLVSIGGIVSCRNDDCPICLNELMPDEDVSKCVCGNCFHTQCIKIICGHPAPRRNCPMCRIQWNVSCAKLARTESYSKKRKLKDRNGGKSRRRK
jgi:hypothetical protein